jgi:hypothetical protein
MQNGGIWITVNKEYWHNGKAKTIIGKQKGCIWCTPQRQAQEDKWSKRKPI